MSKPDEQIIHQGSRFNLNIMEMTGNDGRVYQREVIRHPGAVVLLPLLDDDTVVLIRNHRSAIDETLLELPAGTREADEPVEQTAARELAEETGYTAATLSEMHQFYSAPGICDELMHLFKATELTAGDPDREATEQIENCLASRKQVREWIRRGQIRDAKTLVGLYAWMLEA